MSAALAGRGLTRVFPTPSGEVPAVVDVDVEVRTGELLVVRGRSGAGKTTLLNLLGGLDRPTSGSVWLGERELTAMTEDEALAVRRQELAFIFQSFGLIPVLSAAENVEVPLRLLRTDPGERDDRVAAALERVGLADHANQRPHELSGGEQQRVAIARAFVNRPSILLADEPTGNLDPRTSVGIMRLLDRINRTGTTIVMATHDDEIVDQMRKRVIELVDGVVVRDQDRGVYGAGR